MTDSVIKQVPSILEHPNLMMESQSVSGRLTLLGNVYDAASNPVLDVLELNPTNNGHELDIIKIAGAYGKDTNLQNFVYNSTILYTTPDKNKLSKWLTANRLQLPFALTQSLAPDTSIYNSAENIKKNFSIPKQAQDLLEKLERGVIDETTYLTKNKRFCMGKPAWSPDGISTPQDHMPHAIFHKYAAHVSRVVYQQQAWSFRICGRK